MKGSANTLTHFQMLIMQISTQQITISTDKMLRLKIYSLKKRARRFETLTSTFYAK